MKKLTVLLASMLLVFLAAGTLAQDVRPIPSEQFLNLVAGKTCPVRVSGYGTCGEEADIVSASLSLTVCERDRFDPKVIESLQAGDVIHFGNGETVSVKEVASDDTGLTVKSEDEAYYFFKDEAGTYIATNETDNPYWKDVFTVEVPLEKEVVFRDFSDPEAKEATVLGFRELLQKLTDGVSFQPYNAQVTFDENGKLTVFEYTYSPWN